jgi:DNA polymerase-3 subunit alpha
VFKLKFATLKRTQPLEKNTFFANCFSTLYRCIQVLHGWRLTTDDLAQFPILRESREDNRELLAWEKELLGMYVSDHPVVQALRDVDLSDVTSLGAVNDEMVGQSLTFAGMLSASKTVTTKKGDSMFVGVFEDLAASMECVAFPKSYEKFRALLHDDSVVRIIGKLDRRNDGMQLMIDKVEAIIHSEEPAPKTTAAAPTPTAPTPTPTAPAPTPTTTAPAPTPPPRHAPPPTGNTMSEQRKYGASNHGAHDVIKSPSRAAVSTPKPAPAPVTPESSGPQHVLRLYFPLFDNNDHAVQFMNEIYALTEHFRTADDGEAVLMIHLPVEQRNVVLRMRGTVRDPINLLDILRNKVGHDAIVLESA